MSTKPSALRAALLASAPVFFGYFFVGIAFGLLMQKAGYPVWWAAAASVFVYAGSMQFVLVGLLTHWAGLWQVALITLAVNIRHAFYGLSLIKPFQEMGARRPYMIFSLTDETYSLLCAARPPAGVDKNRFFFLIALLDQGYWVLGSVAGGTIGRLITFDTTGIDFAMTALFVVIFVEQLLSCRCRLPAAVGLVCAAGALAVCGPEHFLPWALALMALAMLLGRRPIEARFDALARGEGGEA